MEIPRVPLHKRLQILLNRLDGRGARIRADGDRKVLLRLLAARQVFNPIRAQHAVRQLNELAVVHVGKASHQQRYTVDVQLDTVDLDAVAGILLVLDEEESAGAEEISDGTGEGTAESGKGGQDGS